MYFLLLNLLPGVPIFHIQIFSHTEFGLYSFFLLQGTKPIHMPAEREHYYALYMQSTYLPQSSLIFITCLNRLDYYVIFYQSIPPALKRFVLGGSLAMNCSLPPLLCDYFLENNLSPYVSDSDHMLQRQQEVLMIAQKGRDDWKSEEIKFHKQGVKEWKRK